MTEQKLKIAVLVALGLVATNLAAWGDPEPVSGRYDADNDWFVLEWRDKSNESQKAIFDPGNKIKPRIDAAVVFDPAAGAYNYRYKVMNGTGSKQLLQDFYIAHNAEISNPASPSNDWYMNEQKGKGFWHWAKTRGTTTGIPAGQFASGFSFSSKSPPGIVDAKFAGQRRHEFWFPNSGVSTEVSDSFSRVFENLKAQHQEKSAAVPKQKTIGPQDPPREFNANESIGNLITLVNQSKAQNWIKTDGIVKSLLAKLNNAGAKVGSDKTAVKNILTAFMNEVSAQNEKQLTAEAYALLYFNAQYVVGHL